MSITDELRRYVNINKDMWGMSQCAENIRCIADRIDAEHAEKLQLAWADGVARAEGDLKAFEATHVKLPVDADGEPIRMGDVMEWSNGSFTVHELKLTEDGWQTWDGEHGYTVHADECIRHVPDSWERIIHDATGVGWMGEGVFDGKDFERIESELVERCRRLAGEAE